MLRAVKRTLAISALYASTPAPQWKRGTPLPTSLLVLRRGENPSTKGVFRVTAMTDARFAAVQRQNGRDRVAIDFEHNTLEGTEAYKAATEPRPVAGYGVARLTQDGIVLDNIEWTKAGREQADNYGDLSPAPFHTPDMTVVGLHSVALVRNGAVYDLSFCSTENGQNSNTEDGMDKFLAALRAAKLIPEAGTETDVVNLITGLSAKLAEAQQALAKVTALTVDQVKTLAGEIVTPQVTALTASIAALQAAAVKTQKDHLLTIAKFEGKVVALSADVVEKLTVNQLKDQIGKTPVTVPMDQRTIATGLGAAPAGGKKYSEEQAAICRACGVDPDKAVWGNK